MRQILEYSLIAVVMVLIGLGVGYFLRKNIAEGKLNQAEQEVRSLSIVGVGVLRGADTSTRGPCWTDLRFTSCAARCTAGYLSLDWISAESI